MLDDITLPMIAIAGGSVLLVLVLCIFWFAARGLARRRRARLDARRTSFHAVVIDPRIAELGRAAFEDMPRREDVIEVVDIELPPPIPVMDYAALHSLQREHPPRRMARGSTPAIVTRAHAQSATEWDVPTAPSVTARMRAYRR
jgi:hypothetical protein